MKLYRRLQKLICLALIIFIIAYPGIRETLSTPIKGGGSSPGYLLEVFDIHQFLVASGLLGTVGDDIKIVPVLGTGDGKLQLLIEELSGMINYEIIKANDPSSVIEILTKILGKNAISLLLYNRSLSLNEKNFIMILYAAISSGDIVPYPFTSIGDLEGLIELLEARNVNLKTFFVYGINQTLLSSRFNLKVKPADYLLNNTLNNSSERFVVVYPGDRYSLLTPFYAIMSRRTLLPVEDLEALKTTLKNYNPRSIVVVASFETLKNILKVEDVYRVVIQHDEDMYLDCPVGILTAIDISSLSLLMARSLLYNELLKSLPRNSLLIFIGDSITLSMKIDRALRYREFKVTRLTGYRKGNLTYFNVQASLQEKNLLVYLNLHGNPLGMAPTTTGPFIISYAQLPPTLPPSIVITLSCETVDLYENYVRSVFQSVAIQFVSRGAIAYIGAMRLEFSGEEAGTGYPDLIVQMLLDGYTFGETVRIVNNLHIAGIKGGKPWQKAYTVLLGDPDLRLATPSEKYELKEITPGKTYEIKFTDYRISLVLKLPLPRNDIAKISFNDPSIRGLRYIERSGEKQTLVLIITKIISSQVGDFEPDTTIIVNIYYKQSLFIWYLIIILVITLVACIIFFYKKK